MLRMTDNYITAVNDNEIFVFGSNEAGRHDGGAARLALEFGAIYGQGEGLQGHTYAIPTVTGDMRARLSLASIQHAVQRFIAVADEHQELTFYVTQIGCGIAGWKPEDIAPLFIGATQCSNIYLPPNFWDILFSECGVELTSIEDCRTV
jgi:hypothetical protein